jgi:hypothetical protein
VLAGAKYWLGSDGGMTFTPSGENTAYTDYADTVPRAMTEHSRTKLIVTAMVYRDLSGTLAEAIDNDHAKITKGDLDIAQRFFSYFDLPNPDPVNLADR